MNFKNFNVAQSQEQPKEEVNSAVKMANISIRVDANCFLLCDGEFTEIELQAGTITKVQLPIGQHLLEFVDIEYPELKMEKVVDWPDEGKSYLVLVNELKKVVDELKAKAETERKAKEEAERNKPIKYEVEDCIYELYPAKYTAALVKSTGTGENIVVLETISYLDNDYSVTAIGNSAFKNCSSLESIDIPDGVMSIGEDAFYECESLTSIVIPDSVKSIGNGAFYCCESLTSIVIPNGVTSIGEYAFYCCESLTSIVIPNGVTSIGEYAFEDCSSLTSIVIPNGVTSIGESAFDGCSVLTSIVIPNGVTSIGDWAFDSCITLTSIVIPDSVKSIGEHAFGYCKALKTIHYEGTKAQWNKINLDDYWDRDFPGKVVHCTDGDVKV